MANPKWFERDLPILDAIVTYFEEQGGRSFPSLADIAAKSGFSVEDVSRAAQNLDGEFIDLSKVAAPPGFWHVTGVHPAARTATGQWPSAESVAAQIIAGLEQTAAQESDPEKQSRLREAAGVLGGLAKDVTTGVLATVILRHTGLG